MKRKASSPQKELILYKELKKSSQDSIQKQNNKINLQSILPKIGQIHSKSTIKKIYFIDLIKMIKIFKLNR